MPVLAEYVREASWRDSRKRIAVQTDPVALLTDDAVHPLTADSVLRIKASASGDGGGRFVGDYTVQLDRTDIQEFAFDSEYDADANGIDDAISHVLQTAADAAGCAFTGVQW